jgi:hypothetical protein
MEMDHGGLRGATCPANIEISPWRRSVGIRVFIIVEYALILQEIMKGWTDFESGTAFLDFAQVVMNLGSNLALHSQEPQAADCHMVELLVQWTLGQKFCI